MKTGSARKQSGNFSLSTRKKFLQTLTKTCNVTKAAYSVDIHRVTAYEYKAKDSEFSLAWDNALKEGIDLLENSVTVRSFKGQKKAVWYQGKKCGSIIEYDTGMQKFLLAAHDRERFGKNPDVNVNHSGGVLVIPTTEASVDDWMEKNSATMEQTNEGEDDGQNKQDD